MADKAATANSNYVTADQLRVGLFVMVDLPWFQHNFARNNFRIASQEQVSELRELKLARIRFDPSKSDPAALAALAATQSPASPAPHVDGASTVNLDHLPTLANQPPVAAPVPPNPVGQREHIAGVDKAFGKAVVLMKNLNIHLLDKPKETLGDMADLVDQMIGVFLSSPEATLHVMADRIGDEEVYYHSLNTSILSMMLAKGLGFDADKARDLGLGTLLHDIGQAELPERIRQTDLDELTPPERQLRRQHVEFGVAIAKKLGLKPPVVEIIAQHHERVDGSGFPIGLKGEQMTESARLVSLVNYYDNLCNPANVKKAMTPHKALSYIYAQCRHQFDPKALQLMIRNLGVYPPGSIVLLSNDALATVTSVNANKPLRPWVMVHEPNVPREQAPLLNLELEPTLSIVKSISPAVLPPRALAYLNPRKRVTYFFDGQSAPAQSATAG